MFGSIVSLADLLLFIVAAAVVGRRPTARSVTAIIAVITLVDLGSVVMVAAGSGMSLSEWYLQALEQQMAAMNGYLPAAQTQQLADMQKFISGCVPGMYCIQSSATVFFALAVRWVIDRIRRKTQWSPFSEVDLPVWTVFPLIVAIVLYIVSIFVDASLHDTVLMVAANVFMVALIPLFVQGAAMGKGAVNRANMGVAGQLVLAAVLLVTGIAFVIVPILGLFDYWVNYRKLPRDGASVKDSEQL
jgi:hypothetical protein